MLREPTLQLIERIKGTELFINVGKPISDSTVDRVDFWRLAAKFSLTRIWYNVRLEARNRITSELSLRHSRRYQRWNDIVDETDELLLPTINAALERIQPAVKLKPRAWSEFSDSVRVDFRGACHEADYSDVVPSDFYQNLMAWYMRGHFPCGWDGTMESGRLIVF
ncbi:MAG: hypothetical protein WBD40_19550 [Tepidisphaeraceae bacterium]